MSAIAPDDCQGPGDQGERRLEELREELREAEVKMALQKKSATMHGVTHDQSGSETVQLGPAVYSELEFEGCRVKALIDTGSLATIVSLNCLLDSLAKGSMRDQTPAEWEAAVKRRLKPPEITLRSYGGGGLDLVGQLLATRVAHIARQLWI